MDKGKRITKALGGVLVGGMLLSGGLVFAEDTNSSPSNGLLTKTASVGHDLKNHGKMWNKKGHFKVDRQKNFQAALDQLVKEGTITREKADEVKSYIDKANKERQARWEEFNKLSPEERKALREKLKTEKSPNQSKGKLGMFNGLVNANILTQEQADALKIKMKEIMIQQRKQRVSNGLKSLVQDGTISAEQSDKIIIQIEKTHNDRKELFEKTKGMTKEERRQFIKDNKGKFNNPLTQLIENGTLTEEQARAVKNAIFEQRN